MKDQIIALKKKYIEKHSAMLTVYSESKLPETTLGAMRSEMKNVLGFIEDLKKLQNELK